MLFLTGLPEENPLREAVCLNGVCDSLDAGHVC